MATLTDAKRLVVKIGSALLVDAQTGEAVITNGIFKYDPKSVPGQ